MSTAKVIAKEGLYVRADRNRKSEPVRTMAYGEEFEFIEEYKGWLAVEDGWVMLSDAWVKPVEMSGSAELPFGEKTEPETFIGSYTIENVTKKVLEIFGHDPLDWIDISDRELSYITLELVTPSATKTFVCEYDENEESTWPLVPFTDKTNGIVFGYGMGTTGYRITVNGIENYLGGETGTLTVKSFVRKPSTTITTIDPKFLPTVAFDVEDERNTCNVPFEEMFNRFVNFVPQHIVVFNDGRMYTALKTQLLDDTGGTISPYGYVGIDSVYAIEVVYVYVDYNNELAANEVWYMNNGTITTTEPTWAVGPS